MLSQNYFHMCLWNKILEIFAQEVFRVLKAIFIFLVLSSLNKLDTATKGTKQFSNPQALSSALAALGTLQPQAFGLLNRLVPLFLASNYYIATVLFKMQFYDGR